MNPSPRSLILLCLVALLLVLPADFVIAQDVPVNGLTDNVPAANVPAANVPAANVPAANVPAANVPADNVPADRAHFHLPPAGDAVNAAQADPIELPAGFALAEVARGFSRPTDMAFLPNGDLFVAEKGRATDAGDMADVYLVHDGVVQPTPVVSIGTSAYGDSGLLGLVLHPEFSDNGWFYLWHTTGEASPGWSGESVLRLTRFTFDSERGAVAPGSEVIIYEGAPHATFHNGGALGFDSDGLIIVGTGDAQNAVNARDVTSLGGKLLRFRPTDVGHEIPEDNPFINVPGAHPALYSIGLRNPFRMTRRQADGALFFGDVGQITYEEINTVQRGVDYGWPEREGPCATEQREPCEPTPSHLVEPVLSYPHPEAEGEGAAITALAFYEGTQFPEEYRNNLFFADIDRQFIARAVPNPVPNPVPDAEPEAGGFTMQPFASNSGFIVDMEYFDEGLYLLDVYEGKVFLIYYSGAGNQPPVAQISASIASGSAPLTVNFSGDGSSDPDDRFLTYNWDFGDGTTRITTEPTLTHTYTRDGLFTASLSVADARGGTSIPAEVPISVYSGALPKIELENLNDPTRLCYHGGDLWRYSVSREGIVNQADLLDGLDAAAPFTWRVEMHHNEHAHPILASNVALGDTFVIDTDNHGGDWNLWYRFYVTMKTDTGQEVTVEREIRPAHVQIDVALETTVTTGTGVFRQELTIPLETSNSGAQVTVNEATQPAPHEMRAIVGTEHFMEAPETLIYDGDVLRFEGWHAENLADEAQNDDTPVNLPSTTALSFTVPSSDTRYIASYTVERAAERFWLPLVAKAPAEPAAAPIVEPPAEAPAEAPAEQATQP